MKNLKYHYRLFAIHFYFSNNFLDFWFGSNFSDDNFRDILGDLTLADEKFCDIYGGLFLTKKAKICVICEIQSTGKFIYLREFCTTLQIVSAENKVNKKSFDCLYKSRFYLPKKMLATFCNI